MLYIAYNYKQFIDPTVKLVYEIADLPKVITTATRLLRVSF